MSYINKELLANEQIIFKTKKHKIIFFYPVLLTVFLLVYGDDFMRNNIILQPFAWVPWLIALLLWVYIGILYMMSAFIVTNKRVLMREGFFYKHTSELRISTISQVNIEQSPLGQLINYGSISLNAFGVKDTFDMLAKPDMFQRAVNQQVDTLTR